MDHIVLKFKIDKIIAGLSDKGIGGVVDHTKSRLGQWYYEGDGSLKYASLPSFKAFAEPHAATHKNGMLALESIEKNKYADGIIHLENMEKASVVVFKQLSALEKEIK